MPFLTAEWRKLILANYEINPEKLQSYLPAHTELDLWEGRCYVSLVGFMFRNTKVLGLKIPLHTNFEEVNLRFYVRYKVVSEQTWKRGVVFIKEIVPLPAITLIANNLYGEHYHTHPMKHRWEDHATHQLVAYQWKHQGKWQSMSVKAAKNTEAIVPNSEAEFIAEHYWGYTKIDATNTSEYEVTHPKWAVYPVHTHQIDVDFGAVYGNNFKELSNARPTSVLLAEGSRITVENNRKIIRSDK